MSLHRLWDCWLEELHAICRIWSGTFPSRARAVDLSLVEKLVMSSLLAIRSLSLVHVKDMFTRRTVRSALSELYVVVWFLALIALLWWRARPSTLAYALVGYRLIDGLNYRLCILYIDRYRRGWALRSLPRTLLLLVLNYGELVVGFAALYRWSGAIARSQCPGVLLATPLDSLYFSSVTMTTLGYGDFAPVGDLGRRLVVSQLFAGFVFVVLVMGAFLTGVNWVQDARSRRPR